MLANFWLKIPSEGCQKINNTKFNFAIPHLSHKCIALTSGHQLLECTHIIQLFEAVVSNGKHMKLRKKVHVFNF